MELTEHGGVHDAWNRTQYSYDNFLDDKGNPAGGYYRGLGLDIEFQNGPIGPGQTANGCGVENLTQAALERVVFYQEASDSRFACHENARMIYHLGEALRWMNIRTEARQKQGVEGSHLPHDSRVYEAVPDVTEENVLAQLNLPTTQMTGRSIHPEHDEGYRRGVPGMTVVPPADDGGSGSGDDFTRRVLEVLAHHVVVTGGLRSVYNMPAGKLHLSYAPPEQDDEEFKRRVTEVVGNSMREGFSRVRIAGDADDDNDTLTLTIEPSRVFSEPAPAPAATDTADVVNAAWKLVNTKRVADLSHAYSHIYEGAYAMAMEFQNERIPQSKPIEAKRRMADRAATYVAGRTMAELFDWKSQRDQE